MPAFREAKSLVDYCDRCGTFAEGKRKWMFYQGNPAREFFCISCQHILRAYAVVGFTLLGILVAALTTVALWLRSLR